MHVRCVYIYIFIVHLFVLVGFTQKFCMQIIDVLQPNLSECPDELFQDLAEYLFKLAYVLCQCLPFLY